MLQSAWLLVLPEDHKRADALALRRLEDNIAKGRIPRNTGVRSLRNERLGARTECAGSLYFHPLCTWHDFVENPHNLPDLDDFIDVKGIDDPDHRMILYPNSNPDWAYLLVRAEGENSLKYHIIGWCWGREGMTVPLSDPVGDSGRGPPMPAHFVPQTAPFMKSPGLLFEEQRRRRKLAAEGARLW